MTQDKGRGTKDRLRICLVSAAYRPYPSGVSEHVHHLAEGLRDLVQDVNILTTTFSGFGDCQTSLPVTRFGRAMLIPMNRSYATVPVGLRMPGEVRRFLAEGGFDVVHCHGLFWPEISYWAIRHSRSVNLITFLTAGFKIQTTGASTFRFLFRQQLAKIHGRIAISQRAREAAEPYVPGEFRIIPCGIDLNRFRPALSPGTPGHRNPASPTILFLGRLDARKGIETLLRALPRVLKSIPGVRLAVVGRGPVEPRARRICGELGIAASVDFLGVAHPEELPRHYANCDVYCAPGLGGETLGIVLLEAMASGTPVVASRIPGYDETVRDGVDGILVPPGDADALAAALIRVLTDETQRRALTDAGLRRAQEYAWPKIAQRTLEFYQELLKTRPV
ncbi:glycosyltransferase family 4 protein [candidate division WOR-3 bacterium]|uniref:Glycosyltransferase family 4 protein n=1 Tax=candidate division WOR-3 bacterium TaxID=2052148 RepID=A0A938BQP9_UNCW3|nr:glycosyltransferase family 4 protein [candidate division WOR-3 bacterium]